MKKQAIVKISIDTDAKPGSSSTARHEGTVFDGTNVMPMTAFDVNVVPSELDGAERESSVRSALAHELGHVVGYLSESKATMDDPRSKPIGNRWTNNPGDAVRAGEKEAWDIAREIDPGINPEDEKRALASYDDPAVNDTFEGAILAEAIQELITKLEAKRGKKEDKSTVN